MSENEAIHLLKPLEWAHSPCGNDFFSRCGRLSGMPVSKKVSKVSATHNLPELTQTVYALIKEKYPDIVLESPIQGWVYLEQYKKGIENFDALPSQQRTAKDMRWVAMCYFQVNEDQQAVLFYQTALYQGATEAGIGLAQAYMFTERMSLVIPQLEQVNFDTLSPGDKVFFLRIRSYYYEVNAKLSNALSDAELAWAIGQTIPEWTITAPYLLRQLGILYGRMGKAQRSFWFFEHSFKVANDNERFGTLLARIEVLIMLGSYLEAREELEKIKIDLVPESYQALFYLRWGDVHWTERSLDKAIEMYEQAAMFALKNGWEGEEVIARINLIPLNIAKDYPLTAGEHQARAKAILSDEIDKLIYRFRDALLLLTEKMTSPQQTLETLTDLSSELKELGYLQEHGWVLLHAAEMKRKLSRDFSSDLDELQKLAVVLQNNNFLSREWALLPELFAIAQETHPKIAGRAPGVIEIFTMGEERIVHNGKTVPIPLRRAIEMIAYFLDNGGRISLKKLRADLFPDDDPQTSRNYFHQFRHELHTRLPMFHIAYNNEQQLYEIKTDLTVLWDVAELRAGRKMGGMGLFLPSSGSEWAELMEHSLAPQREAMTPDLLKKYYASIGGNPNTRR
jgi:tetratricopeptide (TPR) repeat protein